MIQLRGNVFVCVLDRPVSGIMYQSVSLLIVYNFRVAIALLKNFSNLASTLSLPRHPFSPVCISLVSGDRMHGLDLIET